MLAFSSGPETRRRFVARNISEYAMSNRDSEVPSQEEALRLHRRLHDEDDRTASADLLEAYLDPLVGWLVANNRNVHEHDCVQAAEDALLSLIGAPGSYDPGRAPLWPYLRWAAVCDLRNAWQKERKHRARRVPLESVEDPPDAGNSSETDGLPLEALRERVDASVLDSLSDVERDILDLFSRGARATAEFAPVLGVAHLPPEEQAKEVKRAKERLIKKLQRARRDA